MRTLVVEGALDLAGPGGGGRLLALGDELHIELASWKALRGVLRSLPLRNRRARRASLTSLGGALKRERMKVTVWVAGRLVATFSPGRNGGFLAWLLGTSPLRIHPSAPRKRHRADGL